MERASDVLLLTRALFLLFLEGHIRLHEHYISIVDTHKEQN